MKPIMYLDVDDTLVRWDNLRPGTPGNKAKEFVEWAKKNFEIRWLTAWTPSGHMGDYGKDRLAKIFKVEPLFFNDMDNPLSWGMTDNKTDAIDFDVEPREWVWIEDEILQREVYVLTARHKLDRFIKTNVTDDPDALIKTKAILKQRFHLDD